MNIEMVKINPFSNPLYCSNPIKKIKIKGRISPASFISSLRSYAAFADSNLL